MHATHEAGDSSPSDEELLRRFRTGADAGAFATLVHRYERELFGYLRRFLHDAALADDVFQATFLRVYLKHDTFAEDRRFRPWLYGIATHQAIDAQRRLRRHRMATLDVDPAGADGGRARPRPVAAAGNSPADQAAEDEAGDRAWAAVERLSAAQRGVVTLVYRQGMTLDAVAQRLGIPVGTVKSRLHAALTALRQSWGRPARPARIGVVHPG